MPILDIELVEPQALRDKRALASAIADGVARALDTPRGSTWVKVRYLAEQDYAEDGGGPAHGARPVFVRLLLADWPTAEELASRVERVTRVVAEECGGPSETVHVICEPPARGRIAFGGYLLT